MAQQDAEGESVACEANHIGNPVVTNALTHGLSIVADLFADAGDAVIIPDKNWENYELTFGVRRGAEIVEYPLYNEQNRFNSAGLREALLAQKAKEKQSSCLTSRTTRLATRQALQEGAEIVAAIRMLLKQASMSLP